MAIRIGKKQLWLSTYEEPAAKVKIIFTHARPSAEGIVQYTADSLVRDGDKVHADPAGAALNQLAGLLKGFEFAEGSEAVEVDVDGVFILLSCQPKDPGYREDWYALLVATLPRIMIRLGQDLFGGLVLKQGEEPAPN